MPRLDKKSHDQDPPPSMLGNGALKKTLTTTSMKLHPSMVTKVLQLRHVQGPYVEMVSDGMEVPLEYFDIVVGPNSNVIKRVSRASGATITRSYTQNYDLVFHIKGSVLQIQTAKELIKDLIDEADEDEKASVAAEAAAQNALDEANEHGYNPHYPAKPPNINIDNAFVGDYDFVGGKIYGYFS